MTLDPSTLAGLKNIGAITTTASSALTPIASMMGKNRAAGAAMRTAQEEASFIRADAADAALKERQAAGKLRAQQLAAYLSSGVTLEGSPLLVADETTAEGAKNAQNIETNAARKAKAVINKAGSVERGDIFGTAATTLGALGKGATLLMNNKKKV